MRTTAPSSKQRVDGDINVVPMIDILLVLLVIFMLVQEGRKVINLQLPPVAPPVTPGPEFPPQIVLQLRDDGSYAINGSAVGTPVLGRRLSELYLERPVKTLFVQAAPGRRFEEVVEAMDIAKGAGVQVIGLMPHTDPTMGRDSLSASRRREPVRTARK
jgi:biopolymer transport protein TolR